MQFEIVGPTGCSIKGSPTCLRGSPICAHARDDVCQQQTLAKGHGEVHNIAASFCSMFLAYLDAQQEHRAAVVRGLSSTAFHNSASLHGITADNYSFHCQVSGRPGGQPSGGSHCCEGRCGRGLSLKLLLCQESLQKQIGV